MPPKRTLEEYKAPYPKPSENQRRFVIFLDEKEAELENYRLQLLPGRVENVDGANRHFVCGEVKEETIEGWGYNYYVVTMGPTAGTLMMPFGDAAKKTPKFVPMNNTELIRYNSKLPVVVLVPKDAELRYKIWVSSSAGSTTHPDGQAAEEL